MKDSDDIKMEIAIGGQKFSISVPFSRQNFVRDIESEIGNLFSSLRKKFPKKDERELLAMIIYQYASHYGEIRERHQVALDLAIKCEKKIDDIMI